MKMLSLQSKLSVEITESAFNELMKPSDHYAPYSTGMDHYEAVHVEHFRAHDCRLFKVSLPTGKPRFYIQDINV